MLRKIFLPALLAALAGAAAIPARSEESSAPAAEPVELRQLVREALERNPEILAAERVVESRRARIPQAKAWPDPMVTVGYGGQLLPPFTLMSGDPSSARQFMAEQEIPYPGKTRLRGAIAAREADAEALTLEAVRRRVAAEVKQAYFELYAVDRSLEILRKDREVLERFARVAEIRYSVGKGAQQDVLKAQVELSRLGERETLLEQERRTLEAQLNSLRDFPTETPLGTTAVTEPSAFAYSLDDLASAARTNFPLLERQRTMVEAGRLSVELAEKEIRPDFSVGYTYMQRAGMGDMYGITFSTTLPIFKRNKQHQAIREASAMRQAARRMEQNELTVLDYRLRRSFAELQAAGRLMKLYSQGIVPQSALALESSVASYETGAVDFLTVLANFTTVLEYELAYHQQLAAREKALARLEELTGLELVR
jgi:outer membrane protein TolC